jgi:hypothetical protein
MWFFASGGHAGDAYIYWTMGRAVLNDLTPYVDIYDNKPPGIFFLSALSIWLFDSGALGFMLNALMVLAIPTLFVAVTYFRLRDLPRRELFGIVTLSLLFGLLLSLYTATRNIGWQPEWYGVFFTLLYVCIFAFRSNRITPGRIALASICIFGAVGFKEPFALVFFACALILFSRPRSFLYGFIVPLIVSALSGIVALAFFGMLSGYWNFHLPVMFGGHILRATPLWQRGFQLMPMLSNLWEFSPLFPFVLFAVFLLCIWLYRRTSQFASRRTLTLLVSTYIIIAAVGLRGTYATNHFAVAVPLYATFFFVLLNSLCVYFVCVFQKRCEHSSFSQNPSYAFCCSDSLYSWKIFFSFLCK